MKDDEIEKDVRNLETRIERLETGNASGGNSSIAAAPPQKPKKKLLSDEEAEIFRRNGETKAKVDDAIEREDNITPTALTKKLVEILFTDDERKVSSIRNLGYWRLQYIKEKIMKKFSVTKKAEEDLWKQCKLGVRKTLLPVDPPLAAANDYEDDEDDEENETTDEEDNN